MTIMLTGNKGFVGKAVQRILIDNGHKVIPFDLPEYNLLNFEKYPDNNIDMIIHCAAVADLNESARYLDRNFAANVQGCYNIAKHAKKMKAKLLYISTCCVYGNAADTQGALHEDTSTPEPSEPYSASKLAGEYAIQCVPDLDYNIFRIGTVYGPGMRESLFNYVAMDSIFNDKEIQVHGTGNQTRQYVYITDLCIAIMCALLEWNTGETYNITSAEHISVLKTILTVQDIADKKDAKTKAVKDRHGQIYSEHISTEKAEKLLGWKASTDYLTGMCKTYSWYIRTRQGLTKSQDRRLNAMGEK